MKKLIKWSANFTTDVKLIDSQHKKLIDLINELHHGVHEHVSEELLDRAIDNLITYTIFHFATEEQLAAQHGYPQAGTHRLAHNQFMDKVAQFSEFKHGHQAGRELLANEMLNYMIDWLMNHIQGSDIKLGQFLKAQGVA